jgi:hypothetical protein
LLAALNARSIQDEYTHCAVSPALPIPLDVSSSASIRPAVASLTQQTDLRAFPRQRIRLFSTKNEPRVNETTTADCYPVTVMPGQSRLFLDFCAGALRAFLPLDEISSKGPSAAPRALAGAGAALAAQNPSDSAAPRLRHWSRAREPS